MITNITIENFRGIAKSELVGLRPFSVITGANNAGKTTFLEAIALLEQFNHPGAGPEALELLGVVGGHRQQRGDVRAPMRFDASKNGKISETREGGQRFVEVHPTGPTLSFRSDHLSHVLENLSTRMFCRSKTTAFLAAPTSPDPDILEAMWSRAIRDGYSRDVINAVKQLDPAITNVQLVIEGATPVLYAESDVGGNRLKPWPVSVGGSGFKRLLTTVSQLAGATGVVCVDDPDAFLHPKVFSQLAKLFWGIVENGGQVFLATHNVDLIDALARDINGAPRSEQFGVYGFVRDLKGAVSCKLRMPGASAQSPRRRDDIRELLGVGA